MTPADLPVLNAAALNLAELVRRAETLPLLARADVAMKVAADQAALNLRLVAAIEFLFVRVTALENESGCSSTCEANDNGERGQGQGSVPIL